MSKGYIPPKDPAVQKKLEWWQDLKFGLLMHWGTYSQWGIVESWSICPEDEGWCQRKGPYASNYFAYVTAYENLRKTFNPEKFNPEKWATAAKNAGMRYVVFTTKHHDGFCMFDTAQTDYKITASDCPFHSDKRANIAKAVFAAFRNEGFGIGAYFRNRTGTRSIIGGRIFRRRTGIPTTIFRGTRTAGSSSRSSRGSRLRS